MSRATLPGTGAFSVKSSKLGRKRVTASAVAVAAAVIGGTSAVRADIAGFSGFAAPNITAPTPTGIGYSADGTTFELTNGSGGEGVSGFNSTQQNVSSFLTQFTYTATAGADGATFVIQNSPAGTAAVGGTGGYKGYQNGNVSSSFAMVYNIYGTNTAGVSTNGGNATSQTTPITIANGDAINVTLSYFPNGSGSGTLNENFVDATSNATGNLQFTGVNLASAIGGSKAFVGFTGGTGGVASTQTIKNFVFTGGATFAPIATTGGFNQDIVVEKGAPQNGAAANVTASMDSGVANKSNNTWYEQGYDTAAPTTGLPASGSRFTSAYDASHQFQMQSYTGNNALLIGNNANASSGTFTLVNAQPFAALSLLLATGNGPDTVDVTINYSNTHAATTISKILAPDWFNTGPIAVNANGRVVPGAASTTTATGTTTAVASMFNNVNNNNPKLFQEDISLPDETDPISSITITNDTGGGRTAIFAISGSAISTGVLLYTGTDPGNPANNGNFDNGTSFTFNNGGSAAPFTTGSSVIFDDSATGPHTVNIASGGVVPSSVTFNNSSTNYTLTNGPIAGAGGLTLNGSGTVTLANANTYTGNTTITNNGTIVIASGGSIASGNVNVSSGGVFTVNSGGQPTGTTAFNVIDNGTVNFNNPTRVIGGLTGAGVVNLNGTALTAGVGTAFNGTFGGTGGSLAFDSGTVTINSPGAFSGLTGGISVGRTNTTLASLIVNDNSGTAGAGVPVTVGPGGTITTGATSSGTYAGNIVLNGGGTGTPVLTGGAQINGTGNSTLTLTGVISGTGPVLVATQPNSSVILSGANTYSGETQIPSTDTNSFNVNTLQAGAANSFSPNSGINFVGGSGTSATVVDVNGFNQSVAYLAGGSRVGSTVTNNGGNGATLTITNGNSASGSASFGTLIANGNSSLAIAKTGTGNQIFTGANTYSGGTTITGGTITAGSPTALGTGPVTLNGGTLSLVAPVSNNAITGFNNFTLTQGSTVAGANGPSATMTTLNLTDQAGNEANAAFTTTPVTLNGNGFITTFTYTNNNGADGITFTVQNDPRGNAAVGATGGAFGYGGTNAITKSGAVEFNIFNNGNTATTGTNFGFNGSTPATISSAPVNLDDGNPHQITLTYSAVAQTLTENINDGATSYSNTFNNINFSQLVGGNSAYIGFTGATGGVTATQSVSNFSYGAIINTPQSIANTVTATTGSSTLSVPVSGTLTAVSIGNFTINDGAKVALVSTGTSTAPRAVLSTPSLVFGTGGTTYTGQLDLGKNDLDLPGASLSTITRYVATGFNFAGGANFAGPGITSSAAAADSRHLTAVGVISNTSPNGMQLYGAGTTFDGSNPGASDVLVKYTYFGDANLDGKVDGSDYSLIDNGFAADKTTPGSATGWYNGDFNYDGVVDGSDYTLIDNAFNNQSTPLVSNNTALIASSTSLVAGVPGTSAVPEPTSMAAIAAAFGLLLRRRRAVR